MKKFLFLSAIVLIGCQQEEYINKKYIVHHTETYFIPDSNKQKYAEFVSKALSGCKEDCRWYMEDVVTEGGKLYGIEIVEVKVRRERYNGCNSSNCFDSILLKSELNDEQNEATKNYFVKEN